MHQRTIEPTYNYRNLDLWQQAQDFAAEVVKLIRELPHGRGVEEIARQLLRAAGSVPANIAEGHGRFGIPSYRNHLSIAKGSACEADSWLDLLRRAGLISPEREVELHQRCLVLMAALTRRIRTLEQAAPKSVRDRQVSYATEDPVDGLADDDPSDGSMVHRFQGSSP